MVTRHSPIPLYLQIEHGLQELIDNGQLNVGDRVLSEVDLAREYGVSRMTARKAVDRLVSAGVLFRRQGIGTYVSPRRIHHGLSTKLSFSAAMDSLGLRHDTLVVAADLVRAPAHVLKALGYPASGEALRVKRVRRVEGQPVALHETFLSSSFSLILKHDLTGSLTRAMSAVGANVVTARDSVSATLANDEHSRLLEVGVGAPLLQILGVGLGDDGKPLRFTQAYYRGDRFTFELEAAPPSGISWDIAIHQRSIA